MVDSMTNIETVKRMLRAVEERDGDTLISLYHPQVEFRWPPQLPGYGGTYSGPQQVAAMERAFSELWDPRQPTPQWRDLQAQFVAVDGPSVVVRYRQGGTDTHGRTCEAEVLAHYEVDDGKVRRLSMYYLDPGTVRDFLLA